MPDKPIPEQDPITSKSYAAYYVIATIILILTLFWALWDEAWGQRPWKAFQETWKDRYSAFLNTARSKSQASEKDVEKDPKYAELSAAVKKATQDSAAAAKAAREKLDDASARLLAVQSVFTDRRAYVNALTYELETSESASSKASKQKDIDKYKAEKATVEFPDGSKKQFTFEELEKTYNEIRDERTRISLELGDALKPVTAARAKLDDYVTDHMVDLTPAQIDGLKKKTADWDPTIVQINVAEANIVDRCESCHMGAREPLKITPAAMTLKGAKKPDEYANAFVSHPEPELLKIHDPDKFGCSPCHQGNGRATTSVEKAHGNYEHWLWPLFPKENAQAGCQTCHSADMMLVSGDVQFQTINGGKELFRRRGCNGCHRYEGYDREPEDLNSIGQQIKQIETEKKDNIKQTAFLMKQADAAESNEEANRLNGQAVDLRVANSKLDGRLQQLDFQSHSLMQDAKKIGPNLKDVRLKLNKNWIPVWLKKPTDFRPTTKMPNFRLTDHQIQAISAYIWQSGFTDPLPKHKPGNAAHGKELFESRGCLACHSIGEGDQMMGGTFAANLSRVGEKANYDYLVRWIHNARERTRPYCPYEKKDIGPEDYARKNLPYQWDLGHSKCPNDGHELQVQNMTVMPSLRLAPEDAEDIATYLMSQKKQEPSSYANAAFMDDPSLREEGKKWVRFYGCGGCHEVSGMEDEGRIGTELTFEGSKPIERLDFALSTEPAQRGGKDSEPIKDKEDLARLPDGPATQPWYGHKGFFEHKLAEPNVYDQGKVKGETEALRMPNVHLTKEEVLDLTTFLMGSQETSLPGTYQYKPGDARHDIQEGWWVIVKYNCTACHQIIPGQRTVLMRLPQYQDAQEQLPPKLLTEGARVDPEWLRKFLSNPSLSTTDTNRNGVRPYLKVRMPTFSFSDNELRKLVRFFEALSQQPLPYIPEQVPVLTAKETDMARSLFSSTAAPCLKCHATGDPSHDKIATAPNFLLAKERLKPDWVERWITDPQAVSPGTSMPSGLFKQQDNQWVFAGPTPPTFNGFAGDHRKLLTDYIFQLTAEEQRRVAASMPRAKAAVERPTMRKQAVVESHPTVSGGSR
ncbi:MAG TPA: c-type cytochrome [Candidatus Dormibacteraeota bacterium]|nr:c-type cytochrome [Candidatus Dormibacteraeota bacterium]